MRATCRRRRWRRCWATCAGWARRPRRPPPVPAGPAEALLDRYQRYLVTERGLRPRRPPITRPRPAVPGRPAEGGRAGLAGLTAADVTAFVVATCPAMRKGTAKLTVTSLRSLLGWLHVAGDIAGRWPGRSPSRRLAAGRLPEPLDPAQVAAMLASCDRPRANGRRDLAMFTLLARLGLRAGEVAALPLDDIDWRAGEITVPGKGKRSERLPLPADVGEAVAAYLRDGRPGRSRDAAGVPAGPRAAPGADPGGVTQAVSAAAQRAGLGRSTPTGCGTPRRPGCCAPGPRCPRSARCCGTGGCCPRRSTPRSTSARCGRWPARWPGGAA